jgi:flagellar motor switch protein FliN/FliY
MTQQAAATASTQKSLMEEYASEVAPPSGEAGSASGPGARKPPAEVRKAGDGAGAAARNLDLIMRIPVTMKIVLGSATMPVSNLMKLGPGAIIPLERRVGEPIDVVVNGRVIARGEVVVVDEATSRFGIKLTEVVGPPDSERAT